MEIHLSIIHKLDTGDYFQFNTNTTVVIKISVDNLEVDKGKTKLIKSQTFSIYPKLYFLYLYLRLIF